MTKSMFIKYDNEDGYIMVMCLRDRYIKDLESIGFVDNADKLTTAKPAQIEQSEPKVIKKPSKKKGK